MVDSKNYNILLELQRNARQSDAQIARKLGISEAAVRRRIVALITEGTIRITAVTNHWKVGFDTAPFICIQADLHLLDQVMEALAAMPRVHFISFTTGRFNIIIWVTFRSPPELADFIKNDIAAISGIIRVEVIFVPEFKKRDQKILIDNRIHESSEDKGNEVLPPVEDTRSRKKSKLIDTLDRNIIRELQKDARQSDAQISRNLGMSEWTVRRRIQRFIRDEIINVAAVIDPLKVGYTTPAFIGVQADLSRLDDICGRFFLMPRIHAVALTIGQFDLFLWVTFRSPQELTDFIVKELSKVPGITRTETFIHLQIKKRELGIL
ncbi:MAG: Lrp/AsnC family transcriptional regulator [Pseudomonadota bacterium]